VFSYFSLFHPGQQSDCIIQQRGFDLFRQAGIEVWLMVGYTGVANYHTTISFG
jgi:hypothetical protein